MEKSIVGAVSPDVILLGEDADGDHAPCAAEAVDAGGPDGVVDPQPDQERVGDVGQEGTHGPYQQRLPNGDDGATSCWGRNME